MNAGAEAARGEILLFLHADVVFPRSGFQSLERAMQDCDWVFHAAAVADYWRANRVKIYIVNVNGTINVLNAARRAGVRRVIITSSAAAIGMRDDGRPADETVNFNLPPARFPYGHSKFLAELEVQRAVQDGQDAVILNPSDSLISGTTVQVKAPPAQAAPR